MKLMILILFFPLVVCSQTSRYFTFQTEVDARNILFGGTVNTRGYNGLVKVGFSDSWFRVDAFYETFSIIDYESAGVNLTHLFNYQNPLVFGTGIQISLINKPKKLTPSLGINGLVEYHFPRFFFSARGETKFRTDWDIVVFSGFIGVGFKF